MKRTLLVLGFAGVLLAACERNTDFDAARPGDARLVAEHQAPVGSSGEGGGTTSFFTSDLAFSDIADGYIRVAEAHDGTWHGGVSRYWLQTNSSCVWIENWHSPTERRAFSAVGGGAKYLLDTSPGSYTEFKPTDCDYRS